MTLFARRCDLVAPFITKEREKNLFGYKVNFKTFFFFSKAIQYEELQFSHIRIQSNVRLTLFQRGKNINISKVHLATR